MANKPRYIEEGDQAAHTDVAEGLQQIPLEELDRLLELSGEGGDAAERLAADEVGDASPEEVILLMDRAYGGGRRVGGIGDSALLVSEDGLRAFFRGALPADATYADVMAELEQAGISFGVVPNAIYEILPKRRTSRRRATPRAEGVQAEQHDTVVAEGEPAVAPEEARVEYCFKPVPAEDVQELKQVLEGVHFDVVRQCRAALPFVRLGQVLARVVRQEGTPGRDVFGREIAPPQSDDMALAVGENMAIDPDGRACRAEICGYAGLLDEAVVVLPPLWVARDLMRACFVWLAPQDDLQPLTVADIEALLCYADIVHGIQVQAIETLCRDLEQKRDAARCTWIAHGTEAVPGSKSEWRVISDPRQMRFFDEIERIFTSSQRLDYLVAYCRGLAGRPVGTGEQLAVKKPGAVGKMGRDVFGEKFAADEGHPVELEVGDNVGLTPDGTALCAKIYGYVGSDEECLRILSPIWVAPDRMAAYFVHLPSLGVECSPGVEEIERLLQLAGVRCGVDHRAIALLCEKIKQGVPTDLAVCLAAGTGPQDGAGGHFEFAVDIERRPGVFREDGSVDFKQLSLVLLLEEGALIGTYFTPQKGVPGADVEGREIAASDGEDIAMEVGKNVCRVQEAGEPDRYVAAIEGELCWVDRRQRIPPALHLEVHRTLTVDGDVDYSTGHIDYPGNVRVVGSIRPGFAVKAEGNVAVAGSVDDGARIGAGGNVAVGHGIAGSRTQINCGGSVFAKFVSAARVRAQGDLLVAEYLHRAMATVDGDLMVLGRGGSPRSGTVVGGIAMAGGLIRAHSVGSAAGGPTSLVAGVDAGLLKKVGELEDLIERYRTAIHRTLVALKLERLDAARIRGLLANLMLKVKGPQREAIIAAVKKLMALQQERERTICKKKALEEKLNAIAAKAAIEISGSAAAKTVLRIGDQTTVAGEEIASVTNLRFVLFKKDGEMRLKMTSD